MQRSEGLLSYKLSLPFLGLLVPGAAHVYAGRPLTASLLYGAILATVVLFSWSRLIVTADGFMFLTGTLLGCHLLSAFSACGLQSQAESNSFRRRWILTTGYCFFSVGIGALLFLYKSSIFGVELYQVQSQSMYPTLRDGDYIVVDTWAYTATPVEIFDVVVFHAVENGSTLIKRVHPVPPHFTGDKREHVYLIGDNQSRSLDSRVFGPVAEERVIAKAGFILWAKKRPHEPEKFIRRFGVSL